VTNVLGSGGGGKKKLGELITSRVIDIQVEFIQVIANGAKSNLDKDLLVVGDELSRSIPFTETRDGEKTTVEGDRGRKERLDVKNRFRSRWFRQGSSRGNRRHRSEQRERGKGRNNLLLTSMREFDEAWLNDELS
jgi:hypothetical protein